MMKLISIIIISIIIIFAILGIIDNLFLNGRIGLGDQFNKGIKMFGPLFLSITGIIALVPVLSKLINVTLTPVYKMLGLDPSMAVSSLIAIDMGGYQLSKAVALDSSIGEWAGIIYGSMMGATIVFSLPVGLTSIDKEDIISFVKGILFGIVAIPFGTFIAGLMMNIPLLTICHNLFLPIVFSTLIVIFLHFYSKQTINVFMVFSKIINTISLLGLALAMIKDFILIPLSGYGLVDITTIPFFNILGSTSDGIYTAGSIVLILSGTLPLIYCLTKWLRKPIEKMANKYGMTDFGITGFLLSSANILATYATLSKMKEKEKITNVAFGVCGGFLFGDHLAFVATNSPNNIVPMIVAKLASGIIAVLLVNIFIRKKESIRK